MPDTDPTTESEYGLEWSKKGITFRRKRSNKGPIDRGVDAILGRAARKHLPLFGTLIATVTFGFYVVDKQPLLRDYLPIAIFLGLSLLMSAWFTLRNR